jgi:hypothetical protein
LYRKSVIVALRYIVAKGPWDTPTYVWVSLWVNQYGAKFAPVLSHVRHVKDNFCMKNFLARIITSSNDDTLTLVRVAFQKEGIVTPVLLTEASLCGKEHAI